MKDKNTHRFARLSMAQLTPDKKGCVLYIDTQDDEKISLEVSLSDFGGIVAFLAQVAAHASPAEDDVRALQPMPLSGLGIAAGRHPDESLLMIQMEGLELAFSAPSERLADAAELLSQAAKTLTAKGILH